MKIQLCGSGSGRLSSNVVIEIGENTVRIVIENLVVYSEAYGPDTNTDFETCWEHIGQKLRYYGEA